MAVLLKHFWLLGILTNVANAAIWWARGKKERERDPSLTDSYRSLCLGFVGWGSVPWIKLVWLAALAGGVIAIVAMYFGAVRMPNLDDLGAPER